MDKLACYTSHYTLGRSINTLDKAKGNLTEYPISIFDMVLDSKQKHLCLVENSMTGFLEATKGCETNKLKLLYGLKLEFTKDILNQDEKSLKSRAKYIIFARNNEGYKSLIKIWSKAAKEGYYYNACFDFKSLKDLWNEHLILAVPFYDSFLHLNSLEGHTHVPEFDGFKPIFFLEENGLPFDKHLREKVLDYTAKNTYETLEMQSIYYKSREDYVAYCTFRCINNRTTIEKPEFDHLSSDSFSYERWVKSIT